jgi:hypothetical protein
LWKNHNSPRNPKVHFLSLKTGENAASLKELVGTICIRMLENPGSYVTPAGWILPDQSQAFDAKYHIAGSDGRKY